MMFCILSQPLAVTKIMLPFSRTFEQYRARKERPLLKHFNEYLVIRFTNIQVMYLFEKIETKCPMNTQFMRKTLKVNTGGMGGQRHSFHFLYILYKIHKI